MDGVFPLGVCLYTKQTHTHTCIYMHTQNEKSGSCLSQYKHIYIYIVISFANPRHRMCFYGILSQKIFLFCIDSFLVWVFNGWQETKLREKCMAFSLYRWMVRMNVCDTQFIRVIFTTVHKYVFLAHKTQNLGIFRVISMHFLQMNFSRVYFINQMTRQWKSNEWNRQQ